MTKTHKHRAKIANDSARPPKSSPNDYGNNPYITGEIRGVVYEPEKEVVDKMTNVPE